MDHKDFSSKGGKAKTELKRAASKRNGSNKYRTTVTFRVYRGDNETIKEGVLVFEKKVLEGEESIGLMMETLADVLDAKLGEGYFDDEVHGVEFGDHTIKAR